MGLPDEKDEPLVKYWVDGRVTTRPIARGLGPVEHGYYLSADVDAQLAEVHDTIQFVIDSRLFLIHEVARLAASVHLAEEKQAQRALVIVTQQLAAAEDERRVCSNWEDHEREQNRKLREQLEQAQMELRERAKDCIEHGQDQVHSQMGWNECKRQLAQARLAVWKELDDIAAHVNAECENGCGTKMRGLLMSACSVKEAS